MTDLRLFWLGPPKVEWNGQLVRLEMRKTLALLAYLSLCPKSPTRETLASLFWPEFDQPHALANLRRSLSSLGKSLPLDLLEADRERVGLRRAAWLHVDCEEFEALLAGDPGRDNTAEGVEALEKAAAIYTGEFLEGFTLRDCPEFDDWQLLQREDLCRKLAGGLERLARHYAGSAQWEQALGHARRWAALDPLDEPAQLVLIGMLASAGHRNAAVRQYQEYAALLQETLGQPPTAEAQALYERMRGEGAPGKQDRKVMGATAPAPGLDYREQIAGPVIKTKLYIPGVSRHHVSRLRLVESLQGISSYRLALISAPAGFGKTSLLAEWIAGSSLAVSWLSLDPGDNHPGRFLAYLVHSLQCLDERIGTEAISLLHMPEPPPYETILSSLLNDIASLEEHAALILDDYHAIQAQVVHDMTGFLIEHCPRPLHLVISTRVDPPLPIARLRSHGELLELRMGDLRFSSEEAGTFLNQSMELKLVQSDIETVNERTEGWAAGLQMAALSLKGRADTGKFIQAFSGSHRYIMDYLVEEVFDRQPEEIKQFLLRTSVLERMSAPLCDAVMGNGAWQSQETLEYLEHANLFVERLDEARCWYRYHHLFADLLITRLRQFFPDQVPRLHQRAADWYESQGMLPQVIHHALEAHDYERAAACVEQVAAALWEHGNYFLAFSWFETLPEEVVTSRPWLCMYRAWSLAVDGRVELAEALLEIVEKANVSNRDAADQRNLAGYVDYVRAVIADSRGDLAAMIRFDRDALAKLDVNNRLMRRGITFQLGRAYHLCGDQETSQRIWGEVIRTDQQTGAGFASVISLCMLTWLKVAVGKLKEAEALCHEAAAWIEKTHEPPNSRTAGLVWIVFANVNLEKNQLDLAERYARDAIACFERLGNLYALTMGYVILAGALRRRQDFEGAQAALEKADQVVARRKIYADALAWLRAEKVNLWLTRADLPAARQYLAELRITPGDPVDFTTEVQYIALARVLIAGGQTGQAVGLLERMAERAAAEKRPGRRMKILTVLALAQRAEGEVGRASAALAEALEVAEPEGFWGIFADGGQAMMELLDDFQAREALHGLAAGLPLTAPGASHSK